MFENRMLEKDTVGRHLQRHAKERLGMSGFKHEYSTYIKGSGKENEKEDEHRRTTASNNSMHARSNRRGGRGRSEQSGGRQQQQSMGRTWS
jgi:hypothetical protein